MCDALIELVKKYPNANWDWYDLTINRNISLADIVENPTFAWMYEYVPQNPNVDWEDYLKYKDCIPWDINSVNECLNPEEQMTKQELIKWKGYSRDASIEEINNNPDWPWNWNEISMNSNITKAFIENNIHKINFNWLSSNKLTRQLEIEQQDRVFVVWCLLQKKALNSDVILKVCDEFLYNRLIPWGDKIN